MPACPLLWLASGRLQKSQHSSRGSTPSSSRLAGHHCPWGPQSQEGEQGTHGDGQALPPAHESPPRRVIRACTGPRGQAGAPIPGGPHGCQVPGAMPMARTPDLHLGGPVSASRSPTPRVSSTFQRSNPFFPKTGFGSYRSCWEFQVPPILLPLPATSR